MSLQEKFQITVPPKNDENDKDHQWVTFNEARDIHGNQDHSLLYRRFNKIPSTNLTDPALHEMALVSAGQTDVTDLVTGGLEKGYVKQEMKGTDDQYTGEHTDLFYGDAGGFVERNNYMDRE